ncbi:MAG: cobalamin-binding protein, partial [Deltaproteobacteria bacterium HGW-Deltaproteobacteria-16]
LGIRDGNPKHQVEKIEAAGIPVYVIDPRDIKGIMEAIQGVGGVLGVPARAEALVAEMSGRIAHVRQQVATTQTRPRVFFQLYSPPIVTAGSKTFIHELITIAGGVNLGAGPVDYPRFSWEKVLSLDPDVVVVTAMGGKQKPEQLKAQWQQWPQLSAVRSGRVHVVNDNFFDRPTPRLINGLEALLRILHPELFGAGHVQ